jgi:uncharacterized membrane protein (DUF441 family)
MSDYKPVPKVIWQAVAGIIAGFLVAWLVSQGVQPGAGFEGEVTALLLLVLPVVGQALVGFVAGYMKVDPDRELVKAMRKADYE